MINGCTKSLMRRYAGVQVLEKLKEEGIEITKDVEDKIDSMLEEYSWDANLIYNKVKQNLGV